ncbi:hypothetical protein FHR92_000652 [Fontibacillus solani]|uniref:YvrJ family protein n=1 Tax=Fontibacillus solani TaxID=1572857 RepID=A0A7W3XQ64_9BACL|nr:hypothetical protein [Fontibacillus solani]MBA9084198.1 hypothetical protein [Fontibacillus solani]
MQVTDIVSMVANVGFPVTLCFILIKYVLQNVDEKLSKMEDSLQNLAQEIQRLDESNTEIKPTNHAKQHQAK